MPETRLDKERLLLGYDIGGTKTVVVLARANGAILGESRLEAWASGSWQKDLETLLDHGRMLLRGSKLSESDIHAVGVSAPGPLNPVSGIVIDAPNLEGWEQVPIVERVFEAFKVQVLLENDANAAALAEWRFGAGQGSRNLIYLTMSTGVGAGLILDGRLYRGGSFQAGEFGHIPVVPDGRPCNCGLRGCLEAYVGGGPMAQQIREDTERGEAKKILELAEGDPRRISARLWVEAIREGDAYALGLKRRFLDLLSQGLASLIQTLDPDVIVLGTIIRLNPDLFLDELRDRVQSRSWPSLRHVQIVPGALGDQLPAYAAVSVAALEPSDLAPVVAEEE